MSSVNDYRGFVRFQIESYQSPYQWENFLKTWPEEGERFQTLIVDDFVNAGSDVKQLAQEITQGLSTAEEKSQAIYRHVVQDYSTTTDFGNRWFYQAKLSKLLEEKVGHSEDKNVLIVELHRALDIPAWPVLISTRDNGRFNPNQGDTRQFNYIIAFVQLGQNWEFLDASGRYAPYGLLPPECLTTGGFLLDGSKSDLVRMTIRSVDSFRSDTTIMTVAADGTVNCQTRCTFAGYSAANMSQLQQETDPDEFMKKYFHNRLEAECDWSKPVFAMDSLDQLHGKVEYSSAEMIRELGENKLITPARFAFDSNPFSKEKRFFPVDFMYPFTSMNHVEIVYEPGFTEISLPADTSFDLGGATFERLSFATDSGAVVQTMLVVEKPLFGPDRYAKLREFFENVALTTDDAVAFVSVKP